MDQAETAPADFIYAIGRVAPRIPSLAVEKEFAQATGRSETAGLTDRETSHLGGDPSFPPEWLTRGLTRPYNQPLIATTATGTVSTRVTTSGRGTRPAANG